MPTRISTRATLSLNRMEMKLASSASPIHTAAIPQLISVIDLFPSAANRPDAGRSRLRPIQNRPAASATRSTAVGPSRPLLTVMSYSSGSDQSAPK